ncbi:hypothetical protein [Vibrio rarus]|uniref:hypothetical protein n=1 Tax=Vibrio rarus TaxID=413403 RepID=UPI0021C3F5A9|nr:hypothetical protein [Vibrio rarus]
MDISSNMLLIKHNSTRKALNPSITTLSQGFQTIQLVFSLIEAVRLHRSLMYKRLTQQKVDAIAIAKAKDTLNTLSNRVAAYPYLGSGPERRILAIRLHQLIQNDHQQSLSKHLVLHGQVIRLLFFCCDCAVLMSLKGMKLSMVEYNHQWQGLLDILDALTQYRISIGSAIQNGLRNPKLMVGRAHNLVSKIRRFDKTGFSNQQSLNTLTEQLTHSVHCLVYGQTPTLSQNPASSKEITISTLYCDTSELSLQIFKVYKQVIKHQLERCITAKANASISA